MAITTSQSEQERASCYARSLANIAVAWCVTENDLDSTETVVRELFATYAPDAPRSERQSEEGGS